MKNKPAPGPSKPGIVDRVKFYWSCFRLIRKYKKFFLMGIGNGQFDKRGTFNYEFNISFRGMTQDGWENFLLEHFRLIKAEKELITQYKQLINKEG